MEIDDAGDPVHESDEILPDRILAGRDSQKIGNQVDGCGEDNEVQQHKPQSGFPASEDLTPLFRIVIHEPERLN